MTKRETVVLSAFTGTLLCDFDDYHKYVEKLFGCAIFTQELPMLKEDIKERATEDAMKILNNLSDEIGENHDQGREEEQMEMVKESESEAQNAVKMVLN